MSSTATTDAAAENAPPSAVVDVAAKDAEMCAAAPNHTHTHQPARPHTTPRPPVCSAELRAQLATKDEQMAEQLATKDEQIEELMGKLKVKSGDTVVGLWTSKDKQTVRKVFRGPKGGIYTQTAAGTKISPDEWAEMDEAEACRRIAAHEEWKAASPTK